MRGTMATAFFLETPHISLAIWREFCFVCLFSTRPAFCRLLPALMFRNIKIKRAKNETVQSYFGLIGHGNGWKLRQKIQGQIRANQD
jgi:hypothetical protein